MARLMKTRCRPRDTRADLEALPEEARAELIHGVLFMPPAPQDPHQSALVRLTGLILSWAQAEAGERGELRVAPYDVELPSGDVVQPDLLFVVKQNLDRITRHGLQGVPDLAVEILSPSNPDRDLFVKRALYAENGVPEYWIANPEERAIQVLRLDRDAYEAAGWFRMGETLVSATLPDLEIEISSVFPA